MKTLKEKTNQNIQDLPIIIQLLKNAFCEEILAYYQYIILANFVQNTVGDNKLYNDIVKDFKENAKDELEDHAFWLLNRLKELGTDWVGIENPTLLDQIAMHKYVMPTDTNLDVCVCQIAEAERGAIATYSHLIEYTEQRDPVTHKKMKAIFKDEETHLKEMEDFIQKINDIWNKENNETIK